MVFPTSSLTRWKKWAERWDSPVNACASLRRVRCASCVSPRPERSSWCIADGKALLAKKLASALCLCLVSHTKQYRYRHTTRVRVVNSESRTSCKWELYALAEALCQAIGTADRGSALRMSKHCW